MYATFDDYVKIHPEGEQYRGWLGCRSGVQFIPGTGPHGSLPGGFLWACAIQRTDGWHVLVGDCDDGRMVKPCIDHADAQRELGDLSTLAPFALHELHVFDYHAE